MIPTPQANVKKKRRIGDALAAAQIELAGAEK